MVRPISRDGHDENTARWTSLNKISRIRWRGISGEEEDDECCFLFFSDWRKTTTDWSFYIKKKAKNSTSRQRSCLKKKGFQEKGSQGHRGATFFSFFFLRFYLSASCDSVASNPDQNQNCSLQLQFLPIKKMPHTNVRIRMARVTPKRSRGYCECPTMHKGKKDPKIPIWDRETQGAKGSVLSALWCS